MTPAQLLLILQGIQAAIALAPEAARIVTQAKALFEALFTQRLITKAQQDALDASVDSWTSLAMAGIVPPAWQVRPEPVS
jgi:hypothetical protein